MIFLLTKEDQLEACKKFADYLEKTCDNEVWVFTDPKDFYVCIEVAIPGKIDYVLIDFRTTQLDLFSPYEYISESVNPVPVIMFNDPYPDPERRAAYWLNKNRDYRVPYVTEKHLKSLIPDFMIIQYYLNEHQFSRYLNGICAPQKFIPDEMLSKMKALEEFPQNHSLPKSRKKLFDLFLENKGVPMSEEDLCVAMWNEYNPVNKKNLVAYISELRRACENEDRICVDIVRTGKGMYQLNSEC